MGLAQHEHDTNDVRAYITYTVSSHGLGTKQHSFLVIIGSSSKCIPFRADNLIEAAKLEMCLLFLKVK